MFISSKCLSFIPRFLPLVRAHAYILRASSSRTSKNLKLYRNYSSNQKKAGLRNEPTIYALSTGSGRAAIAIIRCSGPACLDIYRFLCPSAKIPKPRQTALRALYNPSKYSTEVEVLDAGSLVLYFPGPNTVTGEDVIEFHVHGGPAVVKAVLAAISKFDRDATSLTPGVRYAEPGEFTRRAFYNDRLDLTQVEALSDILSAETEQQRRLAMRNTSNTLGQRYESWRNLLLQARGELEALIDFSEDQHFDESPSEFTRSVMEQVSSLRRMIQASATNAAKGELLRNGIKVALLGAPNAGKSSLLNQIVGREAAIVSREAGTTRDVVEVNIDIGGYFCKFGDLAGLRASGPEGDLRPPTTSCIGEVEIEGIKRAKTHTAEADVVVVVVEVQRDPMLPSGFWAPIDPEIIDVLAKCDEQRQRVLIAVNKVDLLPKETREITSLLPRPNLPSSFANAPVFYISCIEPTTISKSVQSLLTGLTETFRSLTEATTLGEDAPGTWDESLGASERQRLLLLDAQGHLDDFLECVGYERQLASDEDIDVVVAAECLRSAAQALGRITARGEAGDAEEVLGVVFEKFCVGK